MTHTEILANLEEIENVARLACEEAMRKRDQIIGAINWGDFSVTEVVYTVSSRYGEEGYEVRIEEADDYNPSLERFLKQFFLDRGYTNPPEFRFEW